MKKKMLAELDGKIKDKEAIIAEQNKVKEQAQQVKEEREEVEKLWKQVEEEKSKMGAASEEEVKWLKQVAEEKEQEADKMQEQIDALEEEKRKSASTIQDKDDEIEKLNAKLKKLEVENGASAKKLMREAQDKFEQLQWEHEKAMHQSERFKIMYKITKAMLLLLLRHSASLASDNMDSFEQIERMNKDYQAKMAVLNAKIKDRDHEIDELAKEKQEWDTKIQELDRELRNT